MVPSFFLLLREGFYFEASPHTAVAVDRICFRGIGVIGTQIGVDATLFDKGNLSINVQGKIL
jgi:hypothetical protein